VKIGSDKSIILLPKKIVWDLFLGAICSSRQDATFAPICSTGSKKNQLVEISQNYPAIFDENSMYLTSNACNFLKIYFYACFKAHSVALHQTRHLRRFSGHVRKKTEDFIAQSLRGVMSFFA
jgi:hypothetical protein